MNLKDAYNKIAEEWHRDHQEDTWWIDGTNKFVSLVGQGSLVLDVGCGGGTKSKYLLEKNLKVVGIDFAENLIKIAKREAPGAEFHVLEIANINKLKQKFNGIFMQAVLLHIPKKEASGVVIKLSKKLKQGGYFYISVKESRPGGVEEEIKTENDYGYKYSRFFSYFSADEIIKYLRDAGFEIIHEDISPTGRSNWVQIIGRKLN